MTNSIKPCPFCGYQPKVSFKYLYCREKKTGEVEHLPYGDYQVYKTAKAFRVTMICKRCHARSKPVMTGANMFTDPYITTYYGRERGGDTYGRIAEADAEWKQYYDKAVEFWNERFTEI